jgi:hypothetical protein
MFGFSLEQADRRTEVAWVAAEVHDDVPTTGDRHGKEDWRPFRQSTVITMATATAVFTVVGFVEKAYIGLPVKVYADGLAPRAIELFV